MPDIALCKNTTCPSKDKYYRFTAKPNELRQSYFSNPPYNLKTKSCNHYYEKRNKI